MAVRFIGVRHHSPACARLVASEIRRLAPRFVLIEGPADFNDRLDELFLEHRLPLAIYAYAEGEGGTRGAWTPFCDYSPEWVALREGRAAGAELRFIDLPSWHPAFAEVENRYRDRSDLGGAYLEALIARAGVDGYDALWDHLFEQPMSDAALSAGLAAHFEHLRGDAAAGPRDGPREAFMAAWIHWAAEQAEGAPVLVVAGGWHVPALVRRWAAAPRQPEPTEAPAPSPIAGTPQHPAPPEVPAPAPIAARPPQPSAPPEVPAPAPIAGRPPRHGSFLVPYGFRRLDSFGGYDSGMPSPGYQQRVWTLGVEGAASETLRVVVERLRAKKQPVSTAELVALWALGQGLAGMRGHGALLRTDLLDAAAATLVKEALEQPLPWSERGRLRPGTHPLLVELVAALAGEQRGRLHPDTPRPPLLFDVQDTLRELDLEPAAARVVRLDLANAADRARSVALHRLAVLEIPGFARRSGPRWATAGELGETWAITVEEAFEAMVIEAAGYGATLEEAAANRLGEALEEAKGLAAVAELLAAAVFIGVERLRGRLEVEVTAKVLTEPHLEVLGGVIAPLLGVYRHDALFGGREARGVGAILEAAFDRGLWLVEGVTGRGDAHDAARTAAVAALRDLARQAGSLAINPDRARSVMERKLADRAAPPALRGAALGFLWSASGWRAPEGAEAMARELLGQLRSASELGDLLGGLFGLAREEVLAAEGLLLHLDALLVGLDDADFVAGLPSLRAAFEVFPPREREALARSALEAQSRRLRGSMQEAGGDPRPAAPTAVASPLGPQDEAGVARLLRPKVGAAAFLEARTLEAEVAARARRWGLEDRHDEGAK